MSRRTGPFSRAWRHEAGATAVEFALVIPIFVAMVMGGMEIATVGFAAASLHFAVEDAARCASVQTTVCVSPAAITSFATTHYAGPKISPVFSYSTGGCGHTVSATATFSLNLIPQMVNIPLTATACYP